MNEYLGLGALKAYATLLGAIATALLAEFGPTPWLTVVAIVAAAVVTWRVPNLELPAEDIGSGG